MKFNHSVLIVSCSSPGDTIRHMGQISRNSILKKAMSRKDGYEWDAILLSGGGNDLIDDAGEIVFKPRKASQDPATFCHEARLLQTLAQIEDGYRRIAELRDNPGSSCMGKPIITHTYDWATPRNSPARFIFVPLLGPWLYPAMVKAKIPESLWIPISDYLISRLRDSIRSLASGSNAIPEFYVVITQNVLQRASIGSTGNDGDWLNEIHPNHTGYQKLAGRISRKVRELIGD
jgi:lysophospholipase L1-like esterase